jgi:chemotaxis methyl-accepting protein methylase
MTDLVNKMRTVAHNYWQLWKSQLNKYYRRLYAQQHQLTSTTATDRYPELFTEAKEAQGNNKNIKILSFGCSTGEECFSLKKYFPGASIIGVDINRQNLKKAASKNIFKDVKFLNSTEENIKTEGNYDLIFCLSVLCRWEDTKYVDNCEKLYSFKKFESTLLMLTDNLLPNGLLVIYNSNFRFEDTSVFFKSDFEIVPTPTVNDSGFVYKFDTDHNRITEPHGHCIYRKKSK